MENTFGQAGENASHRIDTRFRILIQELHNFHAVTQKLAAKEPIGQENLTYDVDLMK